MNRITAADCACTFGTIVEETKVPGGWRTRWSKGGVTFSTLRAGETMYRLPENLRRSDAPVGSR